MELFKSFKQWEEKETKRRIVLLLESKSAKFALKSLLTDKLNKSETIFLLDINRDLSTEALDLFLGRENIQQKFFVFQPHSSLDLFDSVKEIASFFCDINDDLEKSKKFTLIINNFSGLSCFLGEKEEDFLLRLKLISEYLEIILFSKFSQSSGNPPLDYWATDLLSLQDYLEKEENIVEFVKRPGREIKDDLYEIFLLKLAQAKSKEELLSIRREIQASSEQISENQKNSLSSVYRVHLGRIKEINLVSFEDITVETVRQGKI